MGTATGGRRPQKTEDKCNQTVKTTPTKDELNRLKLDYQRETLGQPASIAEYIRQRLSRSGSGKESGQSRHNGLAIQLALAEAIAELHRLNELNSVPQQGRAGEKEPAKGSDDPVLPVQLAGVTSRLQETIEQISAWLYDFLPEKT